MKGGEGGGGRTGELVLRAAGKLFPNFQAIPKSARLAPRLLPPPPFPGHPPEGRTAGESAVAPNRRASQAGRERLVGVDSP